MVPSMGGGARRGAVGAWVAADVGVDIPDNVAVIKPAVELEFSLVVLIPQLGESTNATQNRIRIF